MLAAQQEEGRFTDEEIVGNRLTLLIAGEDTTAYTMAWTTWLLAQRLDIQARWAEEASEALGDARFVEEYETVSELAYGEAVLRESMRLKPVAPFTGFEPLEVTIGRVRIPAGTQVIVLLRHAGLYEGGVERALEFDPERWLGDDEGAAPDQKSFLAFGAGPRFCPGRNLAFLEAKAGMATIARNFETELGGGRRFARGQHLMHQGEPGDRVLILLCGHVKATFVEPDGKEIVLSFRGPGDVLGELSFAHSEPRSSNVVAIEPVEAQALPAAEFRSFLLRTPSAALTLIEVIGRRFRDANRARIRFGASDTLSRVAARLAELCERYGEPAENGVAIRLPLTQEDLAGWTASSRAQADHRARPRRRPRPRRLTPRGAACHGTRKSRTSRTGWRRLFP